MALVPRALATALPTALGALALVHASPAAPDQKAPSVAAPQRGASSIDRYTLPNGIDVLLLEDHRVPQAVIHVGYRVGSRDDPKGQYGMATLIERLLAKLATRHLWSVEKDALWRALGARPWTTGIDSGLDYTRTSTTVAASDLALAVWMESDRMGFGADGAEGPEIEQLREDILDEAREAAGEPYAAVWSEVGASVAGATHPYGRTGTRNASEIASVTPRDVRARMRALYGPANSILLLAGDFDGAKMKPIIATYFGALGGGPKPKPVTPIMPAWTGEQRLRMEANVDKPMALAAWFTPPLYHPDDALLDGVARMLAMRLHHRLVKELKVAVDVGARQHSNQLSSFFTMHAKVAPGRSAGEALHHMDEVIEQIRATGALPQDVRRAKLVLLTETALAGDTLERRALQTASFFVHTGNPDYFSTYSGAYDAFTAAAIRSAAVRNLPAGRRVVVLVEPNASAPKAGQVVKEKP
jgi:zinc protease